MLNALDGGRFRMFAGYPLSASSDLLCWLDKIGVCKSGLQSGLDVRALMTTCGVGRLRAQAGSQGPAERWWGLPPARLVSVALTFNPISLGS
ncbi:hypothetical protein [uncultured Ilumatobacter sp.]|uniref:hypothetical protein n=1 Tax=uncultured Ilumatobacter sp. TaxID=879968 RepID=UPI00374E8667